jgi:putative peptidoglycan lipid II flippase
VNDRPSHGGATRLVGAASLIAAGHVASRVLGIMRERAIAGYFGTSIEVSAFRAAARLPTMVYDLFIGGMLSAALVPVLASYAATRRAELWRAASVLLSAAAAATGLVSVLVWLLAPRLAVLLGGGFQAQGVALVERDLRLIAPVVLAFGLAGTVTGVLYALERFSLPAMAGAVYNTAFIALLFALHDRLGSQALALGVTVGGVAQVALLLPGLRDGRIRPTLDFRHPVVRRVLALYLPIGLGLLVTQGQVLVDTRLASETGPSGLADMSYATSLIQFPHGFVAVAISLAILPQLSATFARRESATFTRMLARGVRTVTVLILPAALGMAALAEPIVSTIYRHGVFGQADASAVSLALYGYVIGLPFAAVDWPLNYAFYARQSTWVPAVVGVVSVAAYLVVAIVFGPVLNLARLGPSVLFFGLVMADTAKQATHAVIMAAAAYWQIGREALENLGRTTAASLTAATGMAVIVGLVDRAVAPSLPASTFGWAARTVLGLTLGVAIYLPVASALGVDEIGWLLQVLRSRLASDARA